MISKTETINKLSLMILLTSIVLFSCNSEQSKEEKNKVRIKDLTEKTERIFIEKYNPIIDIDKIEFRYSYDYKKLFNDTTKSKFVLIKSYINDFDITDSGKYLIAIDQGFYPSITFILYCTKDDFEYLHQSNKKIIEGVFVAKVNKLNRIWFDLEADDEDIIQSFTNDLIAFGSLIDYKIIE